MWAPALIVSAPTSVLMAEAVTSSDPLQSWLSYGAVGAMVVAFAVGLIVPKSTHEKARADLNEERHAHAETRAQLVALQSSTSDRVIPALTKSTLVLEALTPIVQAEIALRRAASEG